MAPNTLTKQSITRGLQILDHIIGTQELLMSVAPIRIMITGGAVSVLKFHSRAATEDVDFLLDPNVDAAAEYRTEFFQAIQTAADTVHGLPSGWLNDAARVFIQAPRRLNLFLESVDQDVVLYKGENLVAYASNFKWSLETKLSRIGDGIADLNKIETDTADSVEIIRFLIERNRISSGRGAGDDQPLPRSFLKNLNLSGYGEGHICDESIDKVAQAYKEKYGKPGVQE